MPPDARRPATATTAGILRPEEFAGKVTLQRLPASPALEPWLEHYWTVRWSLAPAEAYRSEIVPHPAGNLSLEEGSGPHHGLAMPAAVAAGVATRRFTFDSSGQGRVFAAKFRPGGLAAFTGRPAEEWNDRFLPARELFGDSVDGLLADVIAIPGDAERAARVDAYLIAAAPPPDPRYDLLLSIVAGMLADSSLVSVEAVCRRYAVAERTLQRLFRHYVGVGPKWVLRRYRLHDAVTLIDGSPPGEPVDLAELAVRLGWFDQAHFTREFTAQVGQPPAAYVGRRR